MPALPFLIFAKITAGSIKILPANVIPTAESPLARPANPPNRRLHRRRPVLFAKKTSQVLIIPPAVVLPPTAPDKPAILLTATASQANPATPVLRLKFRLVRRHPHQAPVSVLANAKALPAVLTSQTPVMAVRGRTTAAINAKQAASGSKTAPVPNRKINPAAAPLSHHQSLRFSLRLLLPAAVHLPAVLKDPKMNALL